MTRKSSPPTPIRKLGFATSSSGTMLNAGRRSSHRKVSGMNARYSRYRCRFWRMNGRAFSSAKRRWIVGSPTAQPGGSAK